MKLRILGNSIRLRLTQSEVTTFGTRGRVEERVAFRPGVAMVYALEAAEDLDRLVAQYDDRGITVLVPSRWVAGWVETDKVSLEGEQVLESDAVLSILIEKDFKCLHGPESRIDADAFPNPLARE